MQRKNILSASQIHTFLFCQRKWAYEYLDGIKPPPSPAARFGLSVHKKLEDHLTGSKLSFDNPEGKVIRPGLSFLPKTPLPRSQVEKYFKFEREGFYFHGYIDFYEDVGSQTWLVGDHKTCSSFSTALSPEALRKNPQAAIYAQWAFQELKADAVKLRWIYYRTKGAPQARVTEITIKKEEQPSLFWPQLEIASRIIRTVKAKPDSLELPKNLDACFKYGRCPFYGPCKANQKPATANPIRVRKVQVSSRYSAIAKNESPIKENSFHLFVDCAPIKNSTPYQRTIELSDLLKPVLKKIHQEKEIAHYRLVGYGQHVGIMAQYLEVYLKENPLDDRTAVLSSSKTPEGADTLQTLSAAASRVVRGF